MVQSFKFFITTIFLCIYVGIVSKRRNFNSGNISVGCAIDRQAFALFGAQIHTRMKVIGTDFGKRSRELQGYIQRGTTRPFLPLCKSRREAKKEKLNIVYSTNPNFQYEFEEEESIESKPNNQQKLYVSIDKKQRGGKEVTLVEGFVGPEEELKELE